MKKKIYKWILIGFGAILLILIITNPSNSGFKEYLSSQGYQMDNKTLKDESDFSYGRENNYFIFSYFKYTYGVGAYEEYHKISKKYFGVFGNFYECKKDNEIKARQDSIQEARKDSIHKARQDSIQDVLRKTMMDSLKKDTVKGYSKRRIK